MCDKGEFTDTRDGQKYRTVKIGEQVWMAENLNFKIDGSWCYDNDEANGKIYGRLYTWEAAKVACSAGWHLPSYDEWDVLCKAVGGEKPLVEDVVCIEWWDGAGKHLKSKTCWVACRGIKNLDTYGFSALPGGFRSHLDGSFGYAGYGGHWWTATEDVAGCAYCLYMFNDSGDYVYSDGVNKSGGNAVRCLRD
jgi:uncharacterized protein (TIGR02145 family)